MSVTVDAARGTVTINDGVDSRGNAVTGMENLLLQLALDRAAANTARVSLLENQLREQTDKIGDVNAVIGKFLNAAPTDPAKEGGQIAVALSAADLATLRNAKDQSGATLASYFASTGNPATLAAGKSFNEFMTAIKSELNQVSNLNQQTMIQYQSSINQRNQMTEWLANLIQLLATASAQVANSLR